MAQRQIYTSRNLLSDEAIKALNSGTYGEFSGRTPQRRTSQEQVITSNELPMLNGMGASFSSNNDWESNFAKRRKVDTEGARRNYEQRIGHNASDFRNLRNRGYESSYNDIDFSKHSKEDLYLLETDLQKREGELKRRERARSYAPNSPGAKINAWADNLLKVDPMDEMASRQAYINTYGKSRDEVLDAYKTYKESVERKEREEHPFKAGLKDLPSAPDRAIANMLGIGAHEIFEGSDLDKMLNSDLVQGKVKEVNKQRNYTYNSNKLSETEKTLAKLAHKGGDMASDLVASALIGAPFAMGDAAEGIGLVAELNPLISKALTNAIAYGESAGATKEDLIQAGVDEEKANEYANAAGLLNVGARFATGKLAATVEGGDILQKVLGGAKVGAKVNLGQGALRELANKIILADEGTYDADVQRYMAQGASETEAGIRAFGNSLGRIGIDTIIGALYGGFGSLASGVTKKTTNNIDDLNSVWATQNALPQNEIPRLTGTVENPSALPGGKLPMLSDNIYPIQMPGTNGVINLPGATAPIQLPDLSAKSAPISRPMNEAAGWVNPRLVKALEGADLEKAKASVASNKTQIKALKNEIEILKNDKGNLYRGNLKKAVQNEITAKEKQIKSLEKANKDLGLQIKGGITPVKDVLTAEQKNNIYDTSGKYDSVFSQINLATKFAGDTPEAKDLAKQAQAAIREFINTGSDDSVRKLTTALSELDNLAKTTNATYTTRKGNKLTYGSRFGEQAQYLSRLQPVADIYNSEKALAKAAQKAPEGIQVYRGYNRSDNPLESNLAKPKSIYDVIGREDPNKPNMLPLEYYTDSADDAQMYANHDKTFYDSLRKNGERAWWHAVVDKGEDIPDKEAYIKQAMDNAYRTLTGREPVFDNGHVDKLTINPQNVLDLSELGEQTSVDAIYNYLAQLTGKTPSEIDAILKLGDIEYDQVGNIVDVPTYRVLRNQGANDEVGTHFVDFMRNNGYDAVKYKESGANHYALLNDDQPTIAPKTYLNEEKNIYQVPENINEIAANNRNEVIKLPSVASVNTGIFANGEGRLPEKVRKYWAKWGNKAHNEVLGDVKLTGKNVKDSIAHNRLTTRKADTFAVVPDVIEKGMVIDYQPSWKGGKYDTALIVAPTTIVNEKGVPEEYITGVIVRRNQDTQKFYTHDAVSVNINEPSVKTRAISKDTPTEGEGSLSVYSILRKIADSKREYNYSQYEPNFSTVGNPYTPQEIPSVQPTPPTTPPPEQEIPNLGGGQEKTSKYYKSTMRNTEANQGMSDEEYAQRYNEELYKYMTLSEQQSVGMAHDFINEAGGNDAAIQRLLSDEFDNEERFNGIYVDAAHILANDLENQAMQMEAQGLDASEQWRLANRLHKKIQENGTIFAQGLQANKKWKKTTSQGALDDLIMDINRGIDSKKTTGYTKNVNKLADKVEDAIASTDDKNEQIARIKDVFAKDRENNPYSTDKAEQLVLNLVGGSKNTKKNISDLIDEASKLIKKEMGVSSLTPKEERAVLNLLDAASKLEPGTRAYNELVSQAMIIVDEALPTTIGEKAKSLLYDNMLASIKTMFTRNLGGNLVGNTIDALAAPFQVGADALVGKFTGARTRTLNGKMIVEAAKGFGHGFKDWGQDIGYSIKNKTAFNTPRSGQESLKDVLNAVHKTWKTQSQNKAVKAVTNALSAYDYIIRKGMEGGDRPIYEAQYAATKAELYNVVEKYGDKGLRMGLPADKRDIDTDDLIEAIAINDALEAVLQNDSTMKEAAKNLKAFFKKSSEDMLGIDIASMSHAPFVEVPANMASNFFKLTPIGWAGNIARTIGEKKKYGSINQRRFTGELGLNVLGGLMIGGGMAAAGKYISNAYSKDKNEKKLQQNNGYQEYALQTPDESTQVDISDIPYLGGMMKFAKMERDAYDENGLGGALLEMPSAASAATVDTLYQALNRLTGADFQYNGSGNLIQNAVNNVKSSVGSMGIPSYIRQTAQYLDPYKRDLGDYGTDEYNKNLIINGIPILREKMLEPKIDTAGKPVPELGGATGINRFLSAYVSPYKVSHPHENTSAVQEYANMLKQATDGQVNPQMKVINKSDLTKIKGYDAENYSHEDLRKLQEAYYQSNTELGNALINDPWFTNLSYEKQGELLNELWSANKAVNQEKIVREGLTPEQIAEKGDELYTTDNKLAGVIRDDDENHTGLLKWLHDETDRDTMNQKYGTEMSHDNYVKYNDRKEGYAEQRASETDKAKALDMSVDSYEKYEAEYPGGAQGYYDDKQGAIQYGFVDANKVANVDNYRIAKELGNGDPTVIQAYSDYKQKGIKSNAYGAKAGYLANEDRLTDEQKGMIIAGSQDGSKVGSLAGGAKQLYDIGGYAGINYYYLIKSIAEPTYGTSLSKKERAKFFEEDHPELDALWNYEQTPGDKKGQEMYYYLMDNLK